MTIFRPQSLKEACAILRAAAADEKSERREIRLIAGGTDLIPRLNQEFESCGGLCLLSAYPEMTGVRRETDGRLFVGAMTTLTALTKEPLLKRWRALTEAASRAATPQIRNQGTIGGNLLQENRCMYYNNQVPWSQVNRCFKCGGTQCFQYPKSRQCMALFQSDLAPALIAFGAKAQIAGLLSDGDSAGEILTMREIPVEDLYLPADRKNLQPGQIVTGILLPPLNGMTGSAYARWTIRQAFDFPLLSCAAAASFDGDPAEGWETARVSSCRIVFGSAGVKPRRFEAGEKAFEGLSGAALFEAAKGLRKEAGRLIMPFRDTRVDGEARREKAGDLLKEVIENLTVTVRKER